MGKLLGLVAAVVFAAAPAMAQDFGTEWLDEITHQAQQGRGPLPARAVDVSLTGGGAWFWDSNVMLTENDEESSSIFIPYARVHAIYGEPTFDLEADVLGNYYFYSNSELKDEDDGEVRVYGRARQTGPSYSVQVAELLRREIDPIDAVFINRAARVVSNTVPTVSVDITDILSFEAGADYQVVRFSDAPFDDQSDNESVRVDGALVYETPWAFQLVGQGGYQAISYENDQTAGAPPDADGFYVRGGYRGQLLPRLSLTAMAGYAEMQSDEFVGTTVDEEGETADVSVRAKYDAMDKLVVYADYSRLFSFAGAGDPFQIVNSLLGIVEYSLTGDLLLRGRAQLSHTDSSLGVERDYFVLSGSATYQVYEHIVLDGGAAYRQGEVGGSVVADTDYDGVVLHIGAAVTY